MSIQEAKKEIINLLDDMPDTSVMRVLAYLRAFQSLTALDEQTALNLSLIMEEDDEVLKELAK